jgi:hypothetical protein
MALTFIRPTNNLLNCRMALTFIRPTNNLLYCRMALNAYPAYK